MIVGKAPVIDLQNLGDGDGNRLADRVAQIANHLLGTRQRQELIAMVKDLSASHVFIIFSTVDVQCPDLHHHTPLKINP
jgi:hypothetical protein